MNNVFIDECAVEANYNTKKKVWQVLYHTELNGSPLAVAGWGTTLELAAEDFARALTTTFGELREPA